MGHEGTHGDDGTGPAGAAARLLCQRTRILTLLGHLGPRRGELCGLDWTEVDDHYRWIQITSQLMVPDDQVDRAWLPELEAAALGNPISAHRAATIVGAAWDATR